MNWLSDNVQKILGTLTVIVSAVVSYAATGGLNEIIGAREIQMLSLLNVILGAATAGSGFRVTAQAKVAQAIETAIHAEPPRNVGLGQGGFVRPLMLGFLLVIGLPLATMLPACSTFQQVQQLPLDRRLELAYQVHTETTTQVAAALDAGRLSISSAKSYLQLAEGSRTLLDEARMLLGTDVSTASARLELAQKILLQMQSQLTKRDL